MQNQQQAKLFAFKLADQRDQKAQPAQQWTVRDGLAVAGCSLVDPDSLSYRNTDRYVGTDGGIYC
jgi:hypothetical protein